MDTTTCSTCGWSGHPEDGAGGATPGTASAICPTCGAPLPAATDPLTGPMSSSGSASPRGTPRIILLVGLLLAMVGCIGSAVVLASPPGGGSPPDLGPVLPLATATHFAPRATATIGAQPTPRATASATTASGSPRSRPTPPPTATATVTVPATETATATLVPPTPTIATPTPTLIPTPRLGGG